MNEDALEQTCLSWLTSLGYACAFGPEIAPGEPGAEREDYSQPYLPARLRAALARLNHQKTGLFTAWLADTSKRGEGG